MAALLVDGTGSLSKTYYQRNWKTVFPPIKLPEGLPANAFHITKLALPFIGYFYQPAGRIISYTSTLSNLGYHSYEIYNSEEKRVHSWEVLKAGVELGATFKSLKHGLIAHTSMHLAESFYDLRNVTRGDILQKMIPVVSHSLYLLTLFNFSKKTSSLLMGISLAFQSAVNFYKHASANSETKRWNDIKEIDHGVLAGFFAGEALILISLTLLGRPLFRCAHPV